MLGTIRRFNRSHQTAPQPLFVAGTWRIYVKTRRCKLSLLKYLNCSRKTQELNHVVEGTSEMKDFNLWISENSKEKRESSHQEQPTKSISSPRLFALLNHQAFMKLMVTAKIVSEYNFKPMHVWPTMPDLTWNCGPFVRSTKPSIPPESGCS